MRVLRNIFAALCIVSCVSVSCDEVKEYPWNPEWDQYEPDVEDDDSTDVEKPDTNQTEKPDTTVIPTPPPTVDPEPVVGKARMVWIDAAANFKDYANDRRGSLRIWPVSRRLALQL